MQTTSVRGEEEIHARAKEENFEREAVSQVYRSTQQLEEEKRRSGDSLELMLKRSSQPEDNHLAQWVRNSHQIPPPDNEVPIEEWTPEELAARTPREATPRDFS